MVFSLESHFQSIDFPFVSCYPLLLNPILLRIGRPFFFFFLSSVFPQAGETWSRKGKKTKRNKTKPFPYPVLGKLARERVLSAAGWTPVPILKSHVRREHSEEVELVGCSLGDSLAALGIVCRPPTPPWNVPLRTQHLPGSRKPLCWEAAYFLFPV